MTENSSPHRKPCIALMGEFSAGKSTLANLLIGSDPLPVQVIATQLPPVWISHGDDDPYREDLDGNQHPIDINNLSQAPLEETAYIRIFCDEDILTQCDFLDMPGISDPNMSSEIWQRMITRADGVLWCSHATQAWRQSEAAVWAEMPPELYDRSILLLTRIDKIVTDKDRERVIRRVRKETEGLFTECLPISLLQATREQDNFELWAKSGAEQFAKSLVALLGRLAAEFDPEADASEMNTSPKLPGFEGPERPQAMQEPPEDLPSKIVPRRMKVAKTPQREPDLRE